MLVEGAAQPSVVIPAKAGTQLTTRAGRAMDPCFRRDDIGVVARLCEEDQMSQAKSNKRDISGWLVLNKPYDMTSTQAVGKVRWLFGAKKAGHAGTLDPLATGILPIALGEATKTVPAVQDGNKLYRFTIKWGEETTTDDAEGTVSNRSSVRQTAEAIRSALPTFTGEIMQTPPAFSAIMVDGEPTPFHAPTAAEAYALALLRLLRAP